MLPSTILVRVSALLLSSVLAFATEPTPQTKRWWGHVQALSNDAMEGRDTGSPGYARAVQYVVRQFERVKLEPAGEKQYSQTVPLREVRFRDDLATAELVGRTGVRKLRWLEELAVAANAALPSQIDAPLVFIGSRDYAREVDIKGKIIVELNPRQRVKDAKNPVFSQVPEGAVGIIGIDRLDSLEPPRWPQQYSVSVTLREGPPVDSKIPTPLILRFNPEQAEVLFQGPDILIRNCVKTKPRAKYPRVSTCPFFCAQNLCSRLARLHQIIC